MVDLGWVELLFLAALALIVVGPQDLPKLAHLIGKLWGKAQRLYRDSMMGIRKLENEINLASQPDQRHQPSFYDLLPEHVRQAMEVSEPSRDKAYNQKLHSQYQQAVAQIAGQQNERAQPHTALSGTLTPHAVISTSNAALNTPQHTDSQTPER